MENIESENFGYIPYKQAIGWFRGTGLIPVETLFAIDPDWIETENCIGFDPSEFDFQDVTYYITDLNDDSVKFITSSFGGVYYCYCKALEKWILISNIERKNWSKTFIPVKTHRMSCTCYNDDSIDFVETLPEK